MDYFYRMTLEQVQNSISKLENAKSFFLIRWIRGDRKKLEGLRKKEQALIDAELLENDSTYQKLAEANYDILNQMEWSLKSKATANGMTSTYSSHFEGRIFSNGLLYCRRIPKMNFGAVSPVKFIGGINHLGQMEMQASGEALTYFMGTVFSGKTFEKGRFKLTRTKKEFAPDSKMLVVSFVGDPFAGNKRHARIFLDNAVKMQQEINNRKVKKEA